MNKLFQVLVVGIALIGINIAYAQNGAFVVKEEVLDGFWSFDGVETLSIHSGDIDYFCGDFSDVMLSDSLWVIRPDGSIKFQIKGHYHTRVFYPMTPDLFWSDFCNIVNDYNYIIAEGIVHSIFNDNSYIPDFSVPLHKGRNVFGSTTAGTLYDLTGTCPSGMVDFLSMRKWKLDKNPDFPACLPGCQHLQVSKGPEVECTE
jgi:hypothetical protein